MTIEAFSKKLLSEEKFELNIHTHEAAKDHYFKCLKSISKLREFAMNYSFINKEEEINFFKNIKPKFLSPLIYYRKTFDVLSAVPVSVASELNEVKSYIASNVDFFRYYKSGSTLLDEIYFTRQEPDLWLALNSEEFEQNNFTTVYDHKLSKLLAYEKVSLFLQCMSIVCDAKVENPFERNCLAYNLSVREKIFQN